MIDAKNSGYGEDHHEYLVQDVAKASLETSTAAYHVGLSEDSVKQRVAEGFRFINCGFDHMMLMRVMNEHKALFRSLEKELTNEIAFKHSTSVVDTLGCCRVVPIELGRKIRVSIKRSLRCGTGSKARLLRLLGMC